MSNLGERVRDRRRELGLTLRELAQKAKLSAPFLCDVELGKRSIGADSLFRLSQALGMPMDQLMANGGERQTVGVQVKFPQSLARCAVATNMPFRHAICCYWLAQTINDHRLPAQRVGLEDWDWTKFYAALKEFLE